MEILKEFKFPRQGYYVPYKKGYCYFCKICGEVNRNTLFDWEHHWALCGGCGTVDEDFKKADIGDRFKNIALKSIKITREEAKITLSMNYSHAYLNAKACKISWEYSSKRYVFNTETGMSYALPWKTNHGKRIRGNNEFSHIVNTTYGVKYGSSEQENLIPQEILSYLQSVICPKQEIGAYSMNALMLCNRLPMLSDDQIDEMLEIQMTSGFYERNNFRHLFKGVKRSDSQSELMNKVCKNLGIPCSKSAKKMILSVKTTKKLYELKQYGFKNFDCKKNILNTMQEDTVFGLYYEEYDPLTPFIQDLIKVKGEAQVSKMIVELNTTISNAEHSTLLNLYGEAAVMWDQFKAVEMNHERYLRGNIHDIHEHLSLDIDKIKAISENTLIDYSEEELMLEGIYRGYKFHLASNVSEIVQVGADMGNCVGNTWYTERAKLREIYIVLTTMDNKYKACIELDAAFCMIQCKSKFNDIPNGELAYAIEEWVEDKGIIVNNCDDYDTMITGTDDFDLD